MIGRDHGMVGFVFHRVCTVAWVTLSGLSYAALGAQTAQADPSAQSVPVQAIAWERDIPVESAGSAGQALAAFPLDSQVIASARLDLTDLRLFDPAQHPIGHVVRPRYLTQRQCDEQPLAMERLDARVTSHQGFEAIFAHWDSDAFPTQAMVSIADEDFEANVSLWTAKIPAGVQSKSQIQLSEVKWESRIQSEPIYDYSRMLSLRKDVVAWASQGDRLVKIQLGGLSQSQRSTLATLSGRMGQPTEEQFQIATRLLRVESIAFTGQVCRDASFAPAVDTSELQWTQGPKPLAEPDQKRSWYRFSPGGLPLRSLLFHVAAGNLMRSIRITARPDVVRREVVLRGEGDSTQPWTWPVIAEGQLRRIDWGESRDSLLSIAIAMGERMRELAIGVQDRDDPPLQLIQVQGIWEQHQVFFPIAQAGRYRLLFGQHGLPPFQSEFTDMFQRTSAPTFLPVHLGEPRLANNLGAPPSKPWISASTLLSLGLGIGILTLMALLYGVAKKAKAVS